MKITADQIMVPLEQYATIQEDKSIEKAVDVMVNKYRQMDGIWRGYEALLVTDNTDNIIGFITLRTILKAIELCNAKHPWSLIGLWWRNKKGPYLQVKHLMKPIKGITVDIDDNYEQIAALITKKQVNTVLVRSGDKLVGAIRVIDLLWNIDDVL